MQVTTQEIFFSIMRSSIWQKPIDVEIPDGYDWLTVLRMIREQTLDGLVASAIMGLPKDKRPQTLELQDYLISSYANHIRIRRKMQLTIIRVFDELEKFGIKPILMKGESMVRFYPMDCQRGIGDIDILVPEEKYMEAVRILQELSGDKGHEDSMERHYKIEYNGISLEIHQRPLWCANSAYKKPFRRLTQEYINPDKCEKIKLQGKKIRVFPMQYNVLFIFNHLLEHLRDGGIGLKQIIDWTMMLAYISEKGNINLSVLEHDLKASGLLRAWKVMGGIVVKNLGLPKQEFPFYNERLAQKSQGEILHRIIKGGNFGWMLNKQENEKQIGPLRTMNNMLSVIKETRYLWTLFPLGAISSSLGVIKNSLMGHSGIAKKDTVFE